MHYRKVRRGGGRAPWAGESNQGRQPTGAAGSHGPCICCRARADNSGREYLEGAFRQSGHNPSVTSGDKRRLRRAQSASRSNGSCRCRRGVARSYGTSKGAPSAAGTYQHCQSSVQTHCHHCPGRFLPFLLGGIVVSR